MKPYWIGRHDGSDPARNYPFAVEAFTTLQTPVIQITCREERLTIHLQHMRRSAVIALALLGLYWTAAPLLACVVPDSIMTVQERECCKHMPEMCGSAQMPQSHSCCKTEAQSGNTIMPTGNQQWVPVLNSAGTVATPATPEIEHTARVVRDHHPPGEFLPEITALRI